MGFGFVRRHLFHHNIKEIRKNKTYNKFCFYSNNITFLDYYETTKNIYSISYTIVIENGVSDFKELKEKSILEEIFKSEIKNVSKMNDKKIELYDQKGKLLIKSDLYEAEVKNSATNEYEKQENIIKYKGKYYKIYEPKKFD